MYHQENFLAKIELEEEKPEEMLREAMAIAISRLLLRRTKGEERRFYFADLPVDESAIGQKTELSLEGVCFDGVINTAYELLRLYKEKIDFITIINSNGEKGEYLENPEFNAHSYLAVKFSAEKWFGVSPANYKIQSTGNFEILSADNLKQLLEQITNKSGGKWPEADAITRNNADATTSLEIRVDEEVDFTDEIAEMDIPLVQQNDTTTFADRAHLRVYFRRKFKSGESFVQLYPNLFTFFM